MQTRHEDGECSGKVQQKKRSHFIKYFDSSSMYYVKPIRIAIGYFSCGRCHVLFTNSVTVFCLFVACHLLYFVVASFFRTSFPLFLYPSLSLVLVGIDFVLNLSKCLCLFDTTFLLLFVCSVTIPFFNNF